MLELLVNIAFGTVTIVVVSIFLLMALLLLFEFIVSYFRSSAVTCESDSVHYVLAENATDALFCNDIPWVGDEIEANGKKGRVTRSVATLIQPGVYQVELFLRSNQ